VTIDPMLIFYVIMLTPAVLGMLIGWYLKGLTR